MKHLLQILVALCTASPAWAGPVYRWIDDQGVTNYTDTPSKIPPKYKAELTDGAELALISTDHSQSAKSSPASAERVREKAATAAPAEDEQAAEGLWRARFKAIHRRIAQLDLALEQDRTLLASGGPIHCRLGGFSRRLGTWVCTDPWYLEARQRIRQNELELKDAHEALDDLERQASRQAIPREWRQP